VHHPRKFVSPLAAQAVAELKQRMKQNPSARVRMRAHSILLSNRRMGIDVIAAFYGVSRDTVSGRIDGWEKDGFKEPGMRGLFNELACNALITSYEPIKLRPCPATSGPGGSCGEYTARGNDRRAAIRPL